MTGACTQGVDTGFVALGYGKVACSDLSKASPSCYRSLRLPYVDRVPAARSAGSWLSLFPAAMQLAALTAVVSYFWSDVSQLATNSLRAVANRDFRDRHFRFSVGILLATIPIGIAGLSLSGALNACGSPLRTLEVIGWACIVMAVLLALAEIFAPTNA